MKGKLQPTFLPYCDIYPINTGIFLVLSILMVTLRVRLYNDVLKTEPFLSRDDNVVNMIPVHKDL